VKVDAGLFERLRLCAVADFKHKTLNIERIMIIEQMLKNAQTPLLHIADVSGSALFQGDCLDIMPLIPDNSIDLILCDIPYGTTACKWDSVIPFDKMWDQLKRIRKDNTAILLFGSEPFSSNLRMSNMSEFKYDWIWDKKRVSNPMMAKKMPLKNYEIISVFYKQQPIYNPQPTQKSTGKGMSNKGHNETHETETTGKSKLVTRRDYTDVGYPKMLLTEIKVINNLTTDRAGLHPTQKPIELNEYLIKTYSDEGMTVLDFTMGAGASMVASKNLNRKFIGIEKEANYYEIACRRCGF
jgi:site-specific DNA-methyltransferase (adenine-specific)